MIVRDGWPRARGNHAWVRHTCEEAVITSRDDTLAYIEQYAAEDDALVSSRQQGQRWGTDPVSAATGAALRFLASAISARAVVEIGTGCGSSGIWLLRGMRPDGILTTVDIEPEYQGFARDAYQRAGFAANRARLIHGRALDVLPRLRDAAYDMVFLDADNTEYPAYLSEALRLLRPGGITVFNNALAAEGLEDGPLRVPAPSTLAVREVTRQVREAPELTPLLLPVGTGLLAVISSG